MITIRRKRNRGFAMVVFIGSLIVLGSLVAVAFLASSTGLSESVKSQKDAYARSLGQDALSRFYSEFVTEDSFRTSVIASAYVQEKTITRTLEQVSLLESDDTCDVTSSEGCIIMNVALQFSEDDTRQSELLDLAKTNRAVVPQGIAVQATVVGECSNNDMENCEILGSFVQRLVPSQFYQYAFYNQFSSLDPEIYPNLTPAQLADIKTKCGDRYGLRSNGSLSPRPDDCTEIAYQNDAGSAEGSGDVIDGPVFTNDDYILLCGAPSFKDTVYANPKPGQAITATTKALRNGFWLSAADAPNNIAKCGENQPTPPLNIFEGNYNTAGTNIERAPVQASELPTVEDYEEYLEAYTVGNPQAVLTGSYSISITADKYTYTNTANPADTGTRTLPEVLMINGDVQIKAGSTYKGAHTISAENILIEGNLTRVNAETDVLGLVATRQIAIQQVARSRGLLEPFRDSPAVNPVTGSDDVNIDAVMLSLAGSISIKGNASEPTFTIGSKELDGSWDELRWLAGTAPTLNFTGAIASKYQGVYGGYDNEQNFLYSGFKKNFKFDDRLQKGTVSLPFLPSPISGNWARVDLAEVPANL